MLVFVDESGDPGMRGRPNTSRYFVVTAVIFADNEQATACDRAIDALRVDLRLPEHREFHFSKNTPEVRCAFLNQVNDFDFRYVAFALDKDSTSLTGGGFKYKKSLYKLSVRYAFTHANDLLESAHVIFDRCGGRAFTGELKRYLKSRLNEGGKKRIRKVTSQRARTNNLIQMADIVCGAVARSLRSDKKDRNTYRTIIKMHEHAVQIWPK